MDNEFKISCCLRGLCAKGCGRQDKQLNTYDYLAGIPGNSNSSDLVEVQFKHTRKGYYRNDNHLPLEKGDMVAVEATPGHDIGVVTLTGQLVPLQMKKANLKPGVEIKRVYRKARPADLDQYEAAKALEQDTMIRSRKIAKDLQLNMKIGDVEYQGDGNKAIFYYIADARVDFRQLIKVLAEAFHVRIEMKQIGARQEAGRIGGIGPCGRELCCATWMKNFNSVSTTAARFQDISPNPQKLAGQCAKLKCCLNYEVDTYVEASKKLPQRDVALETADATYYQFKTDILAGLVTYSTDKRMAANLVTITSERARAIIQMNKNGEKPVALDDTTAAEPERPIDLVEQEDLHRFDKSKKRKNGNNKRRGQNRGDAKRDVEAKDNQRNKNNVPQDGAARDAGLRESNKERRNGKGQPNRQQVRSEEASRLSKGESAYIEERRPMNARQRNNRGNGAVQFADGGANSKRIQSAESVSNDKRNAAEGKQVTDRAEENVQAQVKNSNEKKPMQKSQDGNRPQYDNRQKKNNRPNQGRSQGDGGPQNGNRNAAEGTEGKDRGAQSVAPASNPNRSQTQDGRPQSNGDVRPKNVGRQSEAVNISQNPSSFDKGSSSPVRSEVNNDNRSQNKSNDQGQNVEV